MSDIYVVLCNRLYVTAVMQHIEERDARRNESIWQLEGIFLLNELLWFLQHLYNTLPTFAQTIDMQYINITMKSNIHDVQANQNICKHVLLNSIIIQLQS